MIFRLRNFYFVAIFCLAFSSINASADVNIAVVDVDYVLSESSAAKSIKKQVEKKRKSFINKVKAEEDKLRNEQKKIESKKSELSKEQLIEKAKSFEKKRIEARSKIQERKKKLDKAYGEAMSNLTKVIYEVCQDIANEKSIDLVITRQNIIVGNMSLDITKEVSERMNKKLPNVTLNVK